MGRVMAAPAAAAVAPVLRNCRLSMMGSWDDVDFGIVAAIIRMPLAKRAASGAIARAVPQPGTPRRLIRARTDERARHAGDFATVTHGITSTGVCK